MSKITIDYDDGGVLLIIRRGVRLDDPADLGFRIPAKLAQGIADKLMRAASDFANHQPLMDGVEDALITDIDDDDEDDEE